MESQDQDDFEIQGFPVKMSDIPIPVPDWNRNISNPRLRFIRKVFGILSCQFSFTALMVYYAQTILNSFFVISSYPDPPTNAQYLLYLSIIGAIITFLIIACNTRLARKVPVNYYLLGAFTACLSYCVSFASVYFSQAT